MFNRTTIIDAKGPSTLRVNVDEHRAPTDDSVRLLREMEGAARQKVVESIRLESNVLDGVVHFERDFLSDQVVAIAHVKLNGRQIEVRETLNSFEYRKARDAGKLHPMAEKLHKAIAARLAAEFLADVMRGAEHRFPSI